MLAIFCCQVSTTSAQTTEPTRYNVYSYMKVAPGMRGDYINLEKAWKKIHLAKKRAGQLDDWSLSEMLSPSGASTEYDFVCRNTFVGEEQLANSFTGEYMPDNWQSLLTVDEIALVLRTGEIRTMVKSEVWSTIDRTVADDINKATIAVFNYFTRPDGKTRAQHIKMEKDIWKPVHDARIKDGSLKGWLMMGLEMPFGSAQPYDLATIDVYADMKAYLAPWTDSYFKKVHPGKDADQMMAQTREVSDLVKGDVRLMIDRLDW